MALQLTATLDEVDWCLLRELQANARLTFSELGRRVGLTPPAVAERVRRLEEAGVIDGYHATVRPDRIGLGLQAFIRVTANEGKCAALGQAVRHFPEVLECHRVTGNDSYIMKAAVANVADLEDLLDRLNIYGDTTTSIVLSSPVTQRAIDPTGRPVS